MVEDLLTHPSLNPHKGNIMNIKDKINSAKNSASAKLTADQLKAKRSAAAKRAAQTRKANKANKAKATPTPTPTVAPTVTATTTTVHSNLPFSTEMDNGLNWAIGYSTQNGYTGIPRPLFSALTISSLYIMGMVRFLNDGTLTGTDKSLDDLLLLKDLTSATMGKYFVKQGWIDKGPKGFVLNGNGIGRLNDRLTSMTDKYSVTMGSILKVVEAMTNGGAVAVGQNVINFNRKIKLWIVS